MKYLCKFDDGTWIHRSEGRSTVVLRRFVGEYDRKPFSRNDREQMQQLDNLFHRQVERLSLQEAKVRIAAVNGGIDPTVLPAQQEYQEEWRGVFEALDSAEQAPPQAQAPATQEGAMLIPQTRLRRFYETLRLFSCADIQEAFANYLSHHGADHLQVLFSDSFAHFSRYRNDEAFCPARNDPWWSRYANQTTNKAKALVARLNPTNWKNAVPVTGVENLAFNPVGYEISPFRTTSHRQRRALFESGKAGTCSGAGGVDLLLANAQDHLPIIGEVKAPGDTNLLLALVQALTYAVEFTTPNQMDRLKKQYEEYDSLSEKCDIYLISFADDIPELRRQAHAIANRLLAEPENPIAARVRRVAFIEADLRNNVAFKCVHLSEVPPV